MSTITVQAHQMLERVLSLEIVRVTERAAVSAARPKNRLLSLRRNGRGPGNGRSTLLVMVPVLVATAKSLAALGKVT